MNIHIPEFTSDDSITSQEAVYRRLRNAIMVGAIKPGAALTMRGLADQMSLSPTPVREALRRLNSENAIAVLDNRRMAVPVMTEQRFIELLETRITLETHAAKRTAPYVSDIIIAKMIEIDTQMDAALERQNFGELTPLNHDFHRVLYMANPHQASMPLIESVWLQLGPFQRQAMDELEEHYLVDRHKEILDALKNRDVAMLTKAIETDIRDGIEKFGLKALHIHKGNHHV